MINFCVVLPKVVNTVSNDSVSVEKLSVFSGLVLNISSVQLFNIVIDENSGRNIRKSA